MKEPDSAGAVAENVVRRGSEPSALKITDVRVATIQAQGLHPLLRIDTNQGVYGLGEVRDGGHPDTALRLKPLLVGQFLARKDIGRLDGGHQELATGYGFRLGHPPTPSIAVRASFVLRSAF